MNKIMHAHIVFFVFSFLFLLSNQSNAKLIYVLDFDGTLVDDARLESSWKTPWVLRRVDSLNSSTQLRQNLVQSPETIQVSAAEYMSLLGQWSVGNGSVGSYKEVRLNEDPYLSRPTLIVPGYYYVDSNSTFRFYKKDQNGENYLAINYGQAKNRISLQKLDPLNFAGPAFPLFVKAMSTPQTVGDVHIFTARNQGNQSFQIFFEQLKQDGFIKYSEGLNKRGLRTLPTLHQLQGLESILYGRDLVEGKKSVAENIIHQLSHSSAELSQDYSAADPAKIINTHTVIIAEDDPINVRALVHLLNELSYGHTTHKLKLVLMNTAPEYILKTATFPYNLRWAVFNQGYPRSATLAEIQNYTGEKSLPQKKWIETTGLSLNSICADFLQWSR